MLKNSFVRPTHVGSIRTSLQTMLFLMLSSGALVISDLGHAQQSSAMSQKPPLIAYFGGAKTARAETVREQISSALERLGHRRGTDFAVTVFSTEGDNSKLREVGQRVLEARPTLIYAGSWDTANQIKALTNSVPVVFSVWSNLASPTFRIVDDLKAPEGNLTGFSAYVNLIPKKLQLLKEAFPKVKNVGFVHGVDIRDERRTEYSEAAKRLGININYRRLAKEDLPQLASKLNAVGDDAYLVAQDDLLLYERDVYVAQLAQLNAPVIHPEDATARGVLMHYFAVLDVEAKVAEYLSKLLRGAKVRDLAVQEPQEFDLSVNVTTLKRNGLTMSRDVLSRARKVE